MHDRAMAVPWVTTAVFADKLVYRLAQFFLCEVRSVGSGVTGLRTNQP